MKYSQRLTVLAKSCVLTMLSFSAHPLWAQKTVTGNAFQTPSGNIMCVYSGSSLRCDIGQTANRAPPKPKDCPVDWGNAFEIPAKGAASRLCYGDTIMGNYPVLPYGAKWTKNGITCESEKTGLTCSNQSTNGFSLSKGQQRFF